MQLTVTQLTDRLVASYASVGGINHLDGKNLPSKHAIADITVDLLRLLFPGFFDEKLIHSSEIKVETATLLDSVLGNLEDEIRKSLEYNPPPELPKKDLRSIAHTYALEFLSSLPRLRELLHTDTEAAFNGDPAALSKEEVIVAYPCIETIAVQRLAHELYLKNIPLIPRIMTEWAHTRSGMDSGQLLRGHKRHPTIEDRVTIYAGATIMGGDTVVGEGSTIGANVFLTNSVPAHSLVVQEEANVKVMSKKEYQRQETEFHI